MRSGNERFGHPGDEIKENHRFEINFILASGGSRLVSPRSAGLRLSADGRTPGELHQQLQLLQGGSRVNRLGGELDCLL